MATKYNFKGLMKERHSARNFQAKEIPEATIKEIITTALDSPSWCNSQPWNVYVVTGKPLEEIKKFGFQKMTKKLKDTPICPQSTGQNFQKDAKKI